MNQRRRSIATLSLAIILSGLFASACATSERKDAGAPPDELEAARQIQARRPAPIL